MGMGKGTSIFCHQLDSTSNITMSLPVPGTVHLVDLANNLAVKHGEGKKDIVLIPQPSSDPNDPLNWGWWRKNHNRLWQCLWMISGCAIISSLSPAYLLIQEDTGIPIANLSTGIGLMYLFLGWGNLIFQPLALNFGRRPVLIFSLLGTALMVLWSAYIQSSGVWYLNRILMGIFFAPVETLVEIVVTDLSFTHERGFHMAIYQWTLWNGALLAPIPAGYIAENHGWRWIQWTGAILGLSVTFLMIFFFEETMYFRQTIRDEFVGENIQETENSSRMSQSEETKGPVDSKAQLSSTSNSAPCRAGGGLAHAKTELPSKPEALESSCTGAANDVVEIHYAASDIVALSSHALWGSLGWQRSLLVQRPQRNHRRSLRQCTL